MANGVSRCGADTRTKFPVLSRHEKNLSLSTPATLAELIFYERLARGLEQNSLIPLSLVR